MGQRAMNRLSSRRQSVVILGSSRNTNAAKAHLAAEKMLNDHDGVLCSACHATLIQDGNLAVAFGRVDFNGANVITASILCGACVESWNAQTEAIIELDAAATVSRNSKASGRP